MDITQILRDSLLDKKIRLYLPEDQLPEDCTEFTVEGVVELFWFEISDAASWKAHIKIKNKEYIIYPNTVFKFIV
jgi:hypothetical protein